MPVVAVGVVAAVVVGGHCCGNVEELLLEEFNILF